MISSLNDLLCFPQPRVFLLEDAGRGFSRQKPPPGTLDEGAGQWYNEGRERALPIDGQLPPLVEKVTAKFGRLVGRLLFLMHLNDM